MNTKKAAGISKNILEYTGIIVGAFLIATFINGNIFAMAQVKQNSMQNTLFDGQKLFEYRLGYNFSAPQRGDIVIIDLKDEKHGIIRNMVEGARELYNNIRGKEEEDRLVKRIIGLPGDKIDIKDGYVYINDEKQIESYVKGKTYPNSMKFPIMVPEGKYFAMGDNREVSLDSRDLGFFKLDQIEGKVLFRTWPLNKFGMINNKR